MRYIFLLAALCLCGSYGASIAMERKPSLEISGVDYQMIQSAVAAISAPGFNLQNFNISVIENADEVVVHFYNLGARGSRGCPEAWPHYDIALKKDRVTVLRAGRVYCR